MNQADQEEILWALGALMEDRGMARVEIPRETIRRFRARRKVLVSFDPTGPTVLELAEPDVIIRPDPVELRRG